MVRTFLKLWFASALLVGCSQPRTPDFPECDVDIGRDELTTWVDGQGNKHSAQALIELLHQHEAWLSTPQAENERKARDRMNAEGVSPRDAGGIAREERIFVRGPQIHLDYSDIRGARLQKRQLSLSSYAEARLDRVSLWGADLDLAELSSASIEYAFLGGASLKKAFLFGAKLNFSHLTGADMTAAELTDAELRCAKLWGTNLTDASLRRTDLFGAVFEPSVNPETRAVAQARNLEFVTHSGDPSAIVTLRRAFQDAGFRHQERQLTYALKRRESALALAECRAGAYESCLSYAFNRVLFDLPVQYGLNPARSLRIWLGMCVLFAFIYARFINRRRGSGFDLVVAREYRQPDTPPRSSFDAIFVQQSARAATLDSAGAHSGTCITECDGLQRDKRPEPRFSRAGFR